MRKEYLEALENIKSLLKDDWVDSYWKSYYEVIKKALQKLESVDNANPSEALRVVDKIIEHLKIGWTEGNFLDLDISFDAIKQALLKAQEDKIIADFIREHYKLSNDINKNYLELKKPITEEEHIKFKENL